jgi:hypothetical protein
MEPKTQTKENLEKKVEKLAEEVAFLKSAVISMIGVDDEGEYRPEFVEEILRLAKKEPTHEFKGSDSFLEDLASV